MAIDTSNFVGFSRTNIQRPEGFANRTDELAKLFDRIFERGFRFVCISGEGGVGKTWLAREFAYQAASRNTFHAVIWTSAKDKELVAKTSPWTEALGRTPKITLERTPASRRDALVKSLDALCTTIAVHSGHPDATEISRNPSAAQEDILSWLRIRKILVAIDDLDGWGDKWADVVRFAESVRPPSVVLLTSRTLLNDRTLPSITTVPLGPFDNRIAEQVLRHLANERKISLESTQCRTILDFAQGNPLMLKLAVGLMTRRTLTFGELRSVLERAGRSAITTHFLYDEIYSTLTTPTQRVAMCLAIIHDEKLPEPTLHRMAEICEIRERLVREAIDELRSVSLTDRDQRDNSEYDMHDLAVDFVISQDPDLYGRFRERIQQQQL